MRACVRASLPPTNHDHCLCLDHLPSLPPAWVGGSPFIITIRYCTAIKDGMMVLGVTQRFRMKHVTTVYYSMMP